MALRRDLGRYVEFRSGGFDFGTTLIVPSLSSQAESTSARPFNLVLVGDPLQIGLVQPFAPKVLLDHLTADDQGDGVALERSIEQRAGDTQIADHQVDEQQDQRRDQAALERRVRPDHRVLHGIGDQGSPGPDPPG